MAHIGTVSSLRYPSALARFTVLSAVLRSVALRSAVVVAAGGLFAVGLAFIWLALTNPLEIEVREGSVWIHVLAKRAGVDIYDSAQVAFVNMNHGPLDPILKTWVSMALPTLPGQVITRFFALLTPFVLFGTAYVMTRRSLAGALLAASTLFLLCLHVSRMTLAGRSDTTALCAAAVCGLLTHQLLVYPSREWSSRSYTLRQVGLGVASAVLFLVSWRYLPVFAALQFVVLAKQLTEPRRALPTGTSRARHLLIWSETTLHRASVSSFCFLLGFAAIWLPTFWIELKGDGPNYYRHFFGFFLGDSGWGVYPAAKFELFPQTLWAPRLGALLLFAGLILLGLFRLRKRPVQLVAWLAMLIALWVTVSYGYYKNEGGGGLHYFFEFFIFAWIFVLHAVCQRGPRVAQAELALLALVFCLLPWRDLSGYYNTIASVRERSLAFRAEVAALTAGEPVFGEETHLFKSAYSGEVLDTGDAADKVAQSGYFGPKFSQTYRKYTAELVRNPPPFVMVGLLYESTQSGVMTPTLQRLLMLRYTRVATMTDSCFAYGGSQALYELKTRQRQRPPL